jgi:DNA-binding MarR family transcriptional regulator
MPDPKRAKTEAAQALAAVAPLAARWIERLLAQGAPSLTVPQYLAMRAIAREGVSGTELARRSGVSSAAVSQLLTGLVEAGLVERRPAEGDRRRHALSLTRSGTRALRAAEASLTRELGSLLAVLPPPERDALARALPGVEAALSGAPPPRRPPPPHKPPARKPPRHRPPRR